MNKDSYSPFSNNLEDSIPNQFVLNSQNCMSFGMNNSDPNLCEINVCRICNIELKTKGILYNHLDFDHFKDKLENLVEGNGPPYTCSKCPMTSHLKWYAAKHISNEHGLRDQLVDEELEFNPLIDSNYIEKSLTKKERKKKKISDNKDMPSEISDNDYTSDISDKEILHEISDEKVSPEISDKVPEAVNQSNWKHASFDLDDYARGIKPKLMYHCLNCEKKYESVKVLNDHFKITHENTPPRTPRISRLKFQVLKATCLN